MAKESTRKRIIDAADRLFYQQGFEHTSFAQIAEAVEISRGNLYHHFKSKDEILEAVIKHRLASTHAMLEQWESAGEQPADRIRSFIGILIMNRTLIMQYGCPVGTLSGELAKLDHAAQDTANELFTLFRIWLRNQFKQLGHSRNADELAMHVLALSQGIATLANAFHDEKFIRREVKRLNEWLDSYV